MIALLIAETRINDISDISNVIKSKFINNYINSDKMIRMNDTSKISNPTYIFNSILNDSIIDMLYPINKQFQLKNILMAMQHDDIKEMNGTMNFFLQNSFFMGFAVIMNHKTSEREDEIMSKIYMHLNKDTPNYTTKETFYQDELIERQLKEKYGTENQNFLKSEGSNVIMLFPSDLNNSQAKYLLAKQKVCFFKFSIYFIHLV